MTRRSAEASRDTHFIRFGVRAKLALALSLLACASAGARAQAVAARPSGDGPVAVEGASIYKEGKLTFDEIEPAKVAPLPKGWDAYNNTAYKIGFGEGVMRGPNMTIQFSVASAADRKLFDSLLVLQAVWDRIDEKYVWADRTIRAPEAGAPDFNSKIITARVNDLGVFVIARPSGLPPAERGVADLSVEIVAPQGKAIGNRELAYDIRVTNRGPQPAEGIVLYGAGFSSDQFVSATPPAHGGGRCKQDGSNYGCKLDLLGKGETAVIRLVLVPREGPRMRHKEEGDHFNVFAYVGSQAADPNPDDNQARSDLLVFPDPNLSPRVKLVAPTQGELFVAPADIKLTAEASDPEGALTKIEFYAGTKLIGAGEPAGKDKYEVVWRGAPPGPHQLVVMVTDAGGRQDYDTFWIRVNGSLTVRIATPRPGEVFNRTSDYKIRNEMTEITYGALKLKASALVGAGGRAVKEVVFRVNDEMPGTREWKEVARTAGEAVGEARYSAAFPELPPGAYRLTVVATDAEGVESVSSPVPFMVKAAPLVKLRPVADAHAGIAPADVTLVAEVFSAMDLSSRDRGRGGGKVDFYADGKLVGSSALDGFVGIARFVWRGVPPGNYSITAVVTDGDGLASAPSPPLHVSVRPQQ